MFFQNFGETGKRCNFVDQTNALHYMADRKTFRPSNFGLRRFKTPTEITGYLTVHNFGRATPAKSNV